MSVSAGKRVREPARLSPALFAAAAPNTLRTILPAAFSSSLRKNWAAALPPRRPAPPHPPPAPAATQRATAHVRALRWARRARSRARPSLDVSREGADAPRHPYRKNPAVICRSTHACALLARSFGRVLMATAEPARSCFPFIPDAASARLRRVCRCARTGMANAGAAERAQSSMPWTRSTAASSNDTQPSITCCRRVAWSVSR